MDPVTALGVAASVAQFLSLACTALDTCRQIRDDASSSTKQNKDLEEAALELKTLRNNLQSTQRNQAPRRIVEIAKSCASATDELLQVLENVRGAGKQISTAKATFRAMRDRKTIEKLQARLQSRQKVLDQLLLQDIWQRFDVLSIEQNKQSADVQKLMDQLRVHHLDSQATFFDIKKTVADSSLNTNRRLVDIETAAQKRFEHADRKEQALLLEAETQRRRGLFLQSLFFPDIHERQENMRRAAPTTFEWMLDPSGNYAGANFYHWLTADASTYWVCGKAASGKSTLMAHVVEHEETEIALEVWSQSRDLMILRFFFWKPGSELQQSIVGLMRSLLYQICQKQPDLIDLIIREIRLAPDIIPTWTEKRLSKAIFTALRAAKNFCFCFFIDGLDEYKGEYDELVDLIFELQALDNCKCCVSSRPEVQLSNRLANCQQLLLQDVNRNDILTFVQHKFFGFRSIRWLEDSDLENLSYEIVYRADGIFLWAVLVTQSVARGIASGDTFDLLWKRLEAAPRGINDLFAAMLRNVDDVHRKSLSFYLQAMRLFSHSILQSIPTLTAANMPGDIRSYEELEQLCQRTELEIVAQSAGMLEIHHREVTDHPDYWTQWNASPIKIILSKTADRAQQPQRVVCTDAIPCPAVLTYEYRKIEWVHRSAYDFLFGGNADATDVTSDVDRRSVTRRLWNGALKYLRAAPSYGQFKASHGITASYTRASKRLNNLLYEGFHLHELSSIKTLCMSELLCSATQLLPEDITGQLDIERDPTDRREAGRNAFWTMFFNAFAPYTAPTLGWSSYWDFIVSHLDESPNPPRDGLLSVAAMKLLVSAIQAIELEELELTDIVLLAFDKLLRILSRSLGPLRHGVSRICCDVDLLLPGIHSGPCIPISCVLPYERERFDANCIKSAVGHFAAAFIRWHALTHLEDTNLSRNIRNEEQVQQQRNVTALFGEISQAVGLHISPPCDRSIADLTVQISARLWNRALDCHGDFSELVETNGTTGHTADVRLISIIPHDSVDHSTFWEARREFAVNLPIQTAKKLIQALYDDVDHDIRRTPEVLESGPVFKEYAMEMIQDIETNEQGLTEQERILAIYSLRSYL